MRTRGHTWAPVALGAFSLGAFLLAATTAAHAQAPVEAGPTADTAPPVETSKPVVMRPLWELGIGVSGLRVPDYRGADQSHSYLLPFPYIVYRGKYLKSDREGTRALLLSSPRVRLDVSLGAAAPSRSNTAAREGMPELPGNAEIGPSLNVMVAESKRDKWKLDLRMPVRAAVSLQRSPKYVGSTFSPNLNLDLGSAIADWNVGLMTGPLYGNRRYHAHYYTVDAPYATADRPAYQARGGYGGWQALASTSRKFGDAWVAGFVRYENLRGAVYEESPLVRRKSALTVGFGFSWILTTSSELVPATP